MKWIPRKERFELIGFNDVKLRVFGAPILAFFFTLMVMNVTPLEKFGVFLIVWIISILHTVFYWEIERLIVIYLRKKYHRFEEYRKRVVIQSVIIVLFTLTICTSSFCFQEAFKLPNDPIQVPGMYYIIGNLIITIIVVSIYEGLYAFGKFKESWIKNEQLEKKNAQAQLESLKNQVNPHFFFNSINTLISVIPEDPKTAVKFAENLSEVYRYILQMKDKEIVSLEEEFNCMEAYKYLLHIRFGDNVVFVCDEISDLSNKFIVPLSIQMLIENCIKHNVVSKENPLEITIELRADYLIVSNILQPKINEEISTKIGLNNIQKRYELLVNKTVEVEKTTDRFIVRIPILKLAEIK